MYVQLGRGATLVSRLWLGTVNFSGRVPDDQAIRLMDEALDRGVNCVDTADIYGWRLYKGHTEELVGRWLRGSGRRDDVVLATKVGEPMSDRVNDRGLSARHVIRSCEASLRRLGVDHIDLYQMHRMDRTVRWDELWQAMDQLVASGKVRYIGSSNFAGWHLAAGQESAARRGSLGLVSEQCLYNLAVRHAELEVLPAARAYGIGVFAWSPLHGGLLSGALRKLAEGTAVKSGQGRAQRTLPALRDTIARYERFCARVGRDPAEVGLAWLLSRPGVSGAVIGPRTTGHLVSALRAVELELSEEEHRELEALFPPVGSGGEVPEAWQN
ncbi:MULTISPECIES: aldo/keto reductase [Streptomyces]|uniref:Aldo/keto reductase n=3 Tax=Streptomyces TaxID=1883 RepID=A0A3M8EQE1_9ACTN|nr:MULTISPECIES: aldo/keto reductase [Streptomyces]KNE79470.1 oxidoreductase [Streptomyces fradiae]OFA40099.1 oxidoreductase [Streptomyces fradiae]PQM19472.1 aldo/keto reductase [Streptomyces xinghaiensis]RKM89888.1 aldo/keto reductase [Streptomyces xinghaiensis]RNC68209.1 aldo/keto reductase [Streptomyces xinghaiensis]